MSQTLNNPFNWTGYLIQHTRENNDIVDVFIPPAKQENWEYIPQVRPTYRNLFYKYMKLGQVLILRHFPSVEDAIAVERLPTSIPLVLEKYDWGDLTKVIPERKDKLCYLFKGGADGRVTIEDRLHKFLPNDLLNIGERDKIAKKRRELSVQDIIQQALIIDGTPQILKYLRGITENESFTLNSTIKAFFKELAVDMIQFKSSGDLGLNDKIEKFAESDPNFSWLNLSLPGYSTFSEIMRNSFYQSTAPISSEEITMFWKLFEQNNFIAPADLQVAEAL